MEAWSFGRPEAKSSKHGAEDIEAAQEDVPLIMENGTSPDSNGHDRYATHMSLLLQRPAVRSVELAGRESHSNCVRCFLRTDHSQLLQLVCCKEGQVSGKLMSPKSILCVQAAVLVPA